MRLTQAFRALRGQDPWRWHFYGFVEKYRAEDLERYGVLGQDGTACRDECGHLATVTFAGHNLLVNNGGARMLDLLIGAGGTVYGNTQSRVGVGDSATAATATDTALNAATNRYFKKPDATFPSRAAQILTWQSTYSTAVANFAWQEWGIDDAGVGTGDGTTPAGNLLNHKVISLGTKSSAAQWIFTVTGTVA